MSNTTPIPLDEDEIIRGYIHLPIVIFLLGSLIPTCCLFKYVYIPKCIRKKIRKRAALHSQMSANSMQRDIVTSKSNSINTRTNNKQNGNTLSVARVNPTEKSISKSKTRTKTNSPHETSPPPPSPPPSPGMPAQAPSPPPPMTPLELQRSRSQSRTHTRNHNGSNITETLQIPIMTKIALLLNILLSMIYLILTTQATLLLFNWTILHANSYCKFVNIVGFSGYVFSRSFLYIFFYLRTYDTFQGSAYRYKKRSIYALCFYALSVGFFISIPFSYYVTKQEYTVQYITNYGGRCIELKNLNFGWIWFIIIIGFCWEIFAAFMSIYMLIYKLFKILNDMKDVSNQHQNKLVLLVCKLVILLLIAIITSYVCIMTIIMGIGYVIIFYSFDTMINMYCLFLTFSFAEKYYQKYFCGNQCTKICFPMIKTCALTCASKKHTNKCFICCCYCCRYCCIKEKRHHQIKIYKEAKKEIQLIVSTK